MQDQPLYKMTPDQGWANMLPILEQELPVYRKSRRFILFWWSAAAVSAALLVSVFALLRNGEPVSTTVADTQHENVTDPSATATVDDSTVAAIEASPSESKLQTMDPLSSEYNSPRISDEKLAANTEGIAARSSSKSETTGNVFGSEAFVIPPQPVTIVSNAVKVVVHPKNTAHDPATSLALSRDDLPVPFLPALPDIELMDQDAGVISPTIVADVSKQDLITPHISLGLQEGYLNGAGAHGGFGIDLNLSPRLSLTADIGMSVYKPDLFTSRNKSQANVESDGLLRNDLGYNGIGTYIPAEAINKSSGNLISPFIKSIRSWHAGIGMKYDIAKRLMLEAGASLAFGSTSRSEYPIVEFDYTGPVGEQFNVGSSFDPYEVISPDMVSVYFGLGYKLGRRLELFAQWMQGLEPYLFDNTSPLNTSSGSTEYVRGLNGGVRYNITGP